MTKHPLENYVVVCGETNNPGAVIDHDALRVGFGMSTNVIDDALAKIIRTKPPRTIEILARLWELFDRSYRRTLERRGSSYISLAALDRRVDLFRPRTEQEELQYERVFARKRLLRKINGTHS